MRLTALLAILFCFQIAIAQKKLTKDKRQALTIVEQLQPQVTEACMQLWKYAETALKEEKSAAFLINLLQNEGFAIEKGVAGMPTAFIATYGSGKPVIGILAEYDALPGVGNDPVPTRKSRSDGIPHGHGCGHNLFGSASVYSAIAVKQLMESNNIIGTLKLYGTPAEETVVGKVYMARDGVFNDLDACLEWHPSQETEVGLNSSLAMNNFMIEFFGQAAHGAADPWNGRSALDAVELMNYAVNQMREHIEPTARIHYVIPNAGEAPNVVPEYAKVWYYVRDVKRDKVEKNYQRVLNIAKAAALATETEYKLQFITGVHAYNINEPLSKALYDNLELVGAPEFTQEEQEWAKEMQRFTGKAEDGLFVGIKQFGSPPTGGSGSTDVAEVSFITPTAGFSVTSAPQWVPWHSWASTASHGTPIGLKAAIVATKVLTLTALDLYRDPKLLESAKSFFLKKTGGKPYISPLPEGQEVPLPGQE